MKKRYFQDQIEADLKNKMVFVSRPRQVGKTTFAKSLVTDVESYLNWDIPAHRETILKRELPLIRAVKKDQKHYHFDWILVPDMAARFENMMAFHLLKWVHYQVLYSQFQQLTKYQI